MEPEMSVCLSEDENTPPNFVTHRNQRLVHYDEDLGHNHFMELKAEISKLMAVTSKQAKDINDLTSTLKEVRLSNQNIESSLSMLTAQNEEFKKQIVSLQNHVKEDREYIVFLENKLEDLNIATRKTTFQMKNVPRNENESKQDLIEMTMRLSETINCKVNKNDIKDIYRVRGKKLDQKNTPIIVETNSAILKADFLKMAKSFNIRNKTKICAKHLGFKSGEDTPVFLSEYLTAKGSRLYFLARDLTKSKGFKFCWTAYGKIYVRKNEQSPIIPIRSEDQVHKLLQEKLLVLDILGSLYYLLLCLCNIILTLLFDAFSLDICTDYELLWCSLLLCQEHLHLIMYLPKNALHISLHKQTSTSRTSTTLYRNTLTYTYNHNS